MSRQRTRNDGTPTSAPRPYSPRTIQHARTLLYQALDDLIPDILNEVPSKVGLDFDLTELSFGIFGFLLVIMMVLRPQGLVPERRRKIELTESAGTGDETLYEARA